MTAPKGNKTLFGSPGTTSLCETVQHTLNLCCVTELLAEQNCHKQMKLMDLGHIFPIEAVVAGWFESNLLQSSQGGDFFPGWLFQTHLCIHDHAEGNVWEQMRRT